MVAFEIHYLGNSLQLIHTGFIHFIHYFESLLIKFRQSMSNLLSIHLLTLLNQQVQFYSQYVTNTAWLLFPERNFQQGEVSMTGAYKTTSKTTCLYSLLWSHKVSWIYNTQNKATQLKISSNIMYLSWCVFL